MDVQGFIYGFFKSREISVFGAYMILNCDLQEFYERITGNDFTKLDESSMEFGSFLFAHFYIKTDPLLVKFFSELEAEYIEDEIEGIM
jgi:hypothetical protein